MDRSCRISFSHEKEVPIYTTKRMALENPMPSEEVSNLETSEKGERIYRQKVGEWLIGTGGY